MSKNEDVPPSNRATLYVLIPPSPLFAAHWSFFITDFPFYDASSKRFEEPKTGRRIHVSGDRLNGFSLEFIRDYDISKHRSVRKYAIAIVSSAGLYHSNSYNNEDHGTFMQKDEDEGGGYVDNRPLDDFEKVCVEVEAPGPSLNRVSDGGKRVKMEVKDCQWWVRQVVRALFEQTVISNLPDNVGGDGKSPIDIVPALPVH